MKRIALLMLAMATLLVSGCQGIKVVDNTYDSIGGKKFHVAEAFEYKGVADVYSKVGTVDGSIVRTRGMKIRSDLFVKADSDKKIEKFAFIERRELGGNYYWLPVKGPRYEFGGYPYAEFMFFSDGSDKHSQYYVEYLKKQGYDLALKKGVVCIALERNFTKNKKGILAECVNVEYLPSRDMSADEIESYLREDFKTVFSSVE